MLKNRLKPTTMQHSFNRSKESTKKYSSSDVSFIWFTDEKVITVAMPNNHAMTGCKTVVTRKIKHLQKCFTAVDFPRLVDVKML